MGSSRFPVTNRSLATSDKGARSSKNILLLGIVGVFIFALVGVPKVALAQVGNGPNWEKIEAAQLDCSDFATKRAAQSVLSKSVFSSEQDDRFKLDQDGDGKACETPQNSKVAEDGTKLGSNTGGDLDCMDFRSQSAAQAQLRKDPSDPNNLDPETNGIACDITPAAYENTAFDGQPVAEAKSDADLDCEDFEYRQEAQVVYSRDDTDPNSFDEDGNQVACENLPILDSNVEEVRAQGVSPSTPVALVQSWPHGGTTGFLIDVGSLMLICSGVLTMFVLWRLGGQR